MRPRGESVVYDELRDRYEKVMGKMGKASNIKIVRAWIGFSDGKPHSYRSCAEDLKTVWAVFKTRKEASEAYQDVRRCELVIRTTSKNRGGVGK